VKDQLWRFGHATNGKNREQIGEGPFSFNLLGQKNKKIG